MLEVKSCVGDGPGFRSADAAWFKSVSAASLTAFSQSGIFWQSPDGRMDLIELLIT